MKYWLINGEYSVEQLTCDLALALGLPSLKLAAFCTVTYLKSMGFSAISLGMDTRRECTSFGNKRQFWGGFAVGDCFAKYFFSPKGPISWHYGKM